MFLFFSLNMLGVYSNPCQTSKMERFAKLVNGWKQLTIFAKSFILDVEQGSECASAIY